MPPLTVNSAEITKFAAILRAGDIAAFPTETVYGLGADASNSDAVLKVFETKGRPRFNPLIVHCADLTMAETLAVFSPMARRLAQLWPGPLTLVLPLQLRAGVSDLVTAGLATIAVRVPAHPLAHALIEALGRPIAAPSANPSGRLSPTSAAQVRTGFGSAVPVLDGGRCEAGLESTILAVEGDKVLQLRAGAVPREELEIFLQRPIAKARENSPVAAPGMLVSHYSPRAPLRLNIAQPLRGESYLAFGPDLSGAAALNLSPAGDLREGARNLFGMLAKLDETAKAIAVAPIPETGLGEAINDRLTRAAAPRDRLASR